jgi:hypothetical protein
VRTRRYTTHCPAGHEYTTENSYINPKNGNRQCRACAVERGRRTFRQKLYGLPLDVYLDLLARQEGCCRICREPAIANLTLAADHDHATGAIRGLLCSRCNNGLGSFREDTQLLQAAIDYLRTGPVFMPDAVPAFTGRRCACGSWAARMQRLPTGGALPVCLTCFGRAMNRTGKGARGRPRVS